MNITYPLFTICSLFVARRFPQHLNTSPALCHSISALMQLAIVVAIVLANALSLGCPKEPADAALIKAVLSLVICVGLAAALRRFSARCQTKAVRDRWHAGLLIVSVVTIYGVLDYPRIVRWNFALDQVVVIDEFVLLIPIVGFLILSWTVLTDLSTEKADTNRIFDLARRLRNALGIARHQLLPALVPVLVVLAIADIVRLFNSPTARVVEVVLIMLILVLLVVFTPWLLKVCWRTQSMPGGNGRNRLEQVLERAQLRIGDILIWQTDGRVINAVVAGLLPLCRYLFLSDGLIERLNNDRLSAIVAHEAGHLRHGHLLQMLVSLLIPVMSLLVVQQMLTHVEGTTDEIQMCSLFGVMLGWIVIHARIAKLLEHQADVAACHILAGSAKLHPEAVSDYSEALTCATGDASTGDWLHPSISTRLAVLRYLARNTSHELQFEAQIRRLHWLLLGVVVLLTFLFLLVA